MTETPGQHLAGIVCNRAAPRIQCCHGTTWFSKHHEDLGLWRSVCGCEAVEIDADVVAWGWLVQKQVVASCPKCFSKLEQVAACLVENEERVRAFYLALQ